MASRCDSLIWISLSERFWSFGLRVDEKQGSKFWPDSSGDPDKSRSSETMLECWTDMNSEAEML